MCIKKEPEVVLHDLHDLITELEQLGNGDQFLRDVAWEGPVLYYGLLAGA